MSGDKDLIEPIKEKILTLTDLCEKTSRYAFEGVLEVTRNERN